jgi:hypothetical protein
MTKQDEATKEKPKSQKQYILDLNQNLLREVSELREENHKLRGQVAELLREAIRRQEGDFKAELRDLAAPSGNLIWKWWRQQAMIHHPDRGGNAKTFQALLEAKDALLALIKPPDHDPVL